MDDAKQMDNTWKQDEQRYFPTNDYRPFGWIVHATCETLERYAEEDLDLETCNECIAHDLTNRALTLFQVAQALCLTSVSVSNYPVHAGLFRKLTILKEWFLLGIGATTQTWHPLKDHSVTTTGQRSILDHFAKTQGRYLSDFAPLFAESNFKWHVNPTLPLTVALESNKALWPRTIAPTIYDYRSVLTLTEATLYCLEKLGKTSHYTCKRFWKRLKKQHLTFTQIAYLMSLYADAIDLYPELLYILGYDISIEWHPAHDDSANEQSARQIYTRFAKLFSFRDIRQIFSVKLMTNPSLPLRVALHYQQEDQSKRK